MNTITVHVTVDDRDWKLDELPEHEQKLLWRTVELSRQALESGNEPFAALLADAEGNVLMEQANVQVEGITDCTGHAETALMRRASQVYTKEQMKTFTAYVSAEPCCMCFGAMYWSGLGRLVYGAREADLMVNDQKNPTLALPCRVVAARGQREIEILGPFPEICPEYLALFSQKAKTDS